MKTCAIIPAYNEEEHIGKVVSETLAHVDAVLVVDDGSSDDTAFIARKADAIVITHKPNLGKGVSLRDGLDWAAANDFCAAVTLDADGQHLPGEIPRFLEAAADADMVVGNRMADVEFMPFVRLQTNRFMSWLVSRMARTHIPDTQCGFRLIKPAAWKKLEVQSRNFDFESEMLIAAGRAGMKITSVPITTIYGDEVSKINPVKDTIRFAKMVWRLW
jgi:glycosyltransferase involved in cell wall biosynthesis